MNYEDYIVKFFNYMYLNFSENENLLDIEKKYQQLLIDYPNYEFICNNNKNFLFIDGFIYTETFLNYLANKIDLNFVGGLDYHSPLTYHFYHEFNSINVQSYILKNKDNEQNKKIILNKIKQKLINYNVFNKYDIEKTFIVQNTKKTSIYDLLLDDLILNVEKNIDWNLTLKIWFEDIFNIKNKEKENLNETFLQNIINLAISIPQNRKEDKKEIISFLESLNINENESIWHKKVDDEYLAYFFVKSMLNQMNYDTYDIEKCTMFFNEIIYERILTSGFSFQNNYAKSENSLYYFVENFWKNQTIDIEIKNFYNRLLKEGPIVESKYLMNKKINELSTNFNLKKINKI